MTGGTVALIVAGCILGSILLMVLSFGLVVACIKSMWKSIFGKCMLVGGVLAGIFNRFKKSKKKKTAKKKK